MSSPCLSVRHAVMSTVYLLNPRWDLQITLDYLNVKYDEITPFPMLQQMRYSSHSVIAQVYNLIFL